MRTLVLLAAASAISDPIWSLSVTEARWVDEGKVVVHVERGNQRVKRFQVVGTVDAPIDEVWEAYTDFANYKRIFQISDSAVRKVEGKLVYGYFFLDLVWPIGPRWTVNATFLDREHYKFSYHRVEGTMKQYDGDLALEAIGPRLTRVKYAARVDPDFPGLPGWILDWVQFQQFPSAITRVREWLQTSQQSRR